LLGIIIYSNTFFCTFQYDDKIYIIDNLAIRNIHDLLNILKYCPCRFVTFLSIAFNYHFHQLHVFGYHLFNLAVHLGSAFFIWWLTLLTLSTPVMKEDKISRHANLIALLAGLVFVSHPLQTEAVTYIWQRTTSMAALFYLLSLCLYVKSRLAPGKFYYLLSLMAAIAAMFTKEIAVTLPLIIVLYEYSFLKTKKNLDWKCLFPFLLTLLIIPLTLLITASLNPHHMRGAAPEVPSGIPPMHYLLTQFRVVVTYIRLSFLPINQNLDYDYPIFTNIFALPVLASLFFLITILYIAKRLFSKYRLVSFSILWFFLTLLPESSILPLQDVIIEHRLYLPLVGYSIFLVSGMYYLFGKNTLHTMAVALTMIIAGYSILTYQRNKVWENEIVLWNDVIQKSPHKARPYNDRGFVYLSQGSFTQALSDFNRAIEINPSYVDAYNNSAAIYSKEGNFTRAMSDYKKAIELDPARADTYYNRALAYSHQGAFNQAISDYNKAIELDPNQASAYNNSGGIYSENGDFTQAISNITKAIKINPNYAEAYNNRGITYYKQGNFTQALSDYKKAIELDPTCADTYFNRALAYSYQGDFNQAISDYDKAIELDPNQALAYNNRGFTYYNQGNFTQAISDYDKAIELDPNFAMSYINRATAYFQLKDYDEAWTDVDKAEKLGVTVNPEFINALKKASGKVK